MLSLERLPYDYDLRGRFPAMRRVRGFEGGAVSTAERDGIFYVIEDESTMADMLIPGEDDDLLDRLICVRGYATSAERDDYLRHRGWSI